MLKGKTALVTGSTSGIGLGIAEAFAAQRCNIVINGFGDAAEIEALRATLEKAHGVTVRYDGADMTKPDDHRGDDEEGGGRIRRGRYSGQQCRHPACRADRRIPAGEMGRDRRDQSRFEFPHHPPCAAGHEGKRLGPHHQYRLGACAGRVAVQVGLCGGQARRRGSDEDCGAGSRGSRASRSTRSARVMCSRRWWRNRSPTPPKRAASPSSR